MHPHRTTDSDSSVRELLRQKFLDQIITHSTPTTDNEFKRVFLHTVNENGENIIGRSFADALLKLSMPNTNLSVRKVNVISENVDGVFKNFYLAVKDFIDVPETQNLRVDALYCADVNDPRRDARLPQTRSENIIQKPAYILGEMQVAPQDFGARLISYMSKIFGSCTTALKANQVPIPTYGVGLCMWNGTSFCEDLGRLSSDNVKNKLNFTEIMGRTIFLGKCEEISPQATRRSIDQQLETKRQWLKSNAVRYFKPANKLQGKDLSKLNVLNTEFNSLSVEEKKVYLWLEFITCAHLMTDDIIDSSLSCLSEERDKKPFKDAYEAIKINLGDQNMNATEIKKKWPDLWGFGELAEIAKEEAETADLARKITDALCKVCLLKQGADEISIPSEKFPTLVSNKELRKRVVNKINQDENAIFKIKSIDQNISATMRKQS